MRGPRPSLTEQLRQNLAACKTPDEVTHALLKLAAAVPTASRSTHRKWSRLAQRRMDAIEVERRAARAAAPLITLV